MRCAPGNVSIAVLGRQRGVDTVTASPPRAFAALRRIERTGEHAYCLPWNEDLLTMNERDVWDRLKALGLFGERITDRLQEGVPDVMCLNSKGHAIWMELKAPKNRTGQTGLRTDQAVWLWRWAKHGGLAIVVVTRPGGSWEVYHPEPDMGWPRRAVEGSAFCDLYQNAHEVLTRIEALAPQAIRS